VRRRGNVGVLITPVEPGAEPQLPELRDTTRGLPLAGEVISTLWVQTPAPDHVDTIE
jgi:hypothetical protein